MDGRLLDLLLFVSGLWIVMVLVWTVGFRRISDRGRDWPNE